MKRQSVLSHFFTTNKKQKQSNNDYENDIMINDVTVNSQTSVLHVANTLDNNTDSIIDVTKSMNSISDNRLLLWSEKQHDFFLEKYSWLFIKNSSSIGCKVCAHFLTLNIEAEKHTHISQEWSKANVIAHGKTRRIQLSSLYKKITNHALSISHIKAIHLLEEAKKNKLVVVVDKINEKYISTTIYIFNIVYSLAKRIRPMSDITEEIELQKKNGLTLGVSLPSRQTAISIVKHISLELRKLVFTKIIEQNSKICIIIDEASVISKISTLVIFLKCNIADFDEPVNLFIDLVELSSTDAGSIYDTLLYTLEKYGFNERYLTENLIGFCSDGASTMLSRKSGVSAILLNKFPKIITITDYRDFVDGRDSSYSKVPESIQQAKKISKVIAVSSAEAERAFSLMNNIAIDKRNSLLVDNISHLITIKLLGKPLSEWDAEPFVKSWLQHGHHTADDVRIKKNSLPDYSKNQKAIWSLL